MANPLKFLVRLEGFAPPIAPPETVQSNEGLQ